MCGGSSPEGSKEVGIQICQAKVFLFLIYFIGPIQYGPAHSLDDSIFTRFSCTVRLVCPEGDALAQGTIDTELLRRNKRLTSSSLNRFLLYRIWLFTNIIWLDEPQKPLG